MAEVHQPTTAGPEQHPEWHEHSDVPSRPLVMFFIIFVVVAIVIHILIWLLFRVYERAEGDRDQAREVSAVQVDRTPPEPHIQSVPDLHRESPRDDLVKMNLEFEQKMTSYGRAAEQGFARIPVSRAMEIMIQQRMLKSAEQSAERSAEQSAAQSSNSATTRPATRPATRATNPSNNAR